MKNIVISASARRLAAKFLGAAAMLCAAAPIAAHATTYDAVTGFSKKVNPSGPWSYTAAGTLLSQKETQRGDNQVHYWFNGQAMPNAALVGRNFASKPYNANSAVIYPDYLDMDPEQVSDVTVRFTAPLAGQYTFKGNFKGTDKAEASHMVEVAVGGTVVFTGTISNFGELVTFNGKAQLDKGDTIDFISLTSGSDANLSTGLKAKIAGH
jgi:hypothetical protein